MCVPVLVLCTKQDMPGAVSVVEVVDALRLRQRPGLCWAVYGTQIPRRPESHCPLSLAETGLGDAFQWLADTSASDEALRISRGQPVADNYSAAWSRRRRIIHVALETSLVSVVACACALLIWWKYY